MKAEKLFRRLLGPLALPVILAACSRTVPQHSSTLQLNFDFGGPPSVMAVAIDADLSRLPEYLLPEVPQELASDPGAEKKWRFHREDANLSLHDGRLRLTARYRGSVEANQFFLTCRLEPVIADITLDVAPALIRDDDQWRLGAKDVGIDIELGEGSDTTCTFLSIDVTSRLKDALNGKDVKGKIRTKVKGAGFALPAYKVRTFVAGPVALPAPDEVGSVCLYPQVEKLTLGERIEGTLAQATLHARVEAHPVAVLSRWCPEHPNPPEAELRSGQPETTGSFTLAAQVAVPYEQVNRQLKRLEGEEFDLDGKKFYLKDLNAADADGRLLIKATTLGYIDGTIYIWGTPVFEGGCSTIRLKDADFTAQSGDWLDQAKIALASLAHDKVVERIEKKAVVDISGPCSALRQAVQGEHSVAGVTLDINVDRLSTRNIRSRKDVLVGEVRLEGTAQAQMQL